MKAEKEKHRCIIKQILWFDRVFVYFATGWSNISLIFIKNRLDNGMWDFFISLIIICERYDILHTITPFL